MPYVDAHHRRMYEEGFIKQVKEWKLTRHVVLTVAPDGSHGRTIRTSQFACEVAETFARDRCHDTVIGYGERSAYGMLHVHLLCSARDARSLKSAWFVAGIGHPEVTDMRDDPEDFRRQTLYVMRKSQRQASHKEGMVFVAAREQAPRVV